MAIKFCDSYSRAPLLCNFRKKSYKIRGSLQNKVEKFTDFHKFDFVFI